MVVAVRAGQQEVGHERVVAHRRDRRVTRVGDVEVRVREGALRLEQEALREVGRRRVVVETRDLELDVEIAVLARQVVGRHLLAVERVGDLDVPGKRRRRGEVSLVVEGLARESRQVHRAVALGQCLRAGEVGQLDVAARVGDVLGARGVEVVDDVEPRVASGRIRLRVDDLVLGGGRRAGLARRRRCVRRRAVLGGRGGLLGVGFHRFEGRRRDEQRAHRARHEPPTEYVRLRHALRGMALTVVVGHADHSYRFCS